LNTTLSRTFSFFTIEAEEVFKSEQTARLATRMMMTGWQQMPSAENMV
jgi:hypothetical protein